MKRIIFLIVVLSLTLWGFNRFVEVPEESQSLGKDLPTFKGKIYIPPKGAPFEEFFMDQAGQIYKLDLEEASEEVTETIKKAKESSGFVEIKGNIKEDKEIIIEEIKEIEKKEKEKDNCPPCI